ncbi:hypothetical protein [Blastopirellula marina]|nr:hypothetical protein [Blastopirellula marina]
MARVLRNLVLGMSRVVLAIRRLSIAAGRSWRFIALHVSSRLRHSSSL